MFLLPQSDIPSYPWSPDRGDGTYVNPIICTDYSDPDVIADGEDFWLTASSFNCTPGLPILHSRDLVNWRIVNYAIKNNPDPRKVFDKPQHGCGVWAPAIRKHDEKFWIFFPMPDEGIYLTTADNPRGNWSEPHLVQAGKGLIDPCPLWDEDGQAYLVHAYARSRSGIKHRLRVCPMAPDGSKLLGDGQIVFDDPEHQPTLEGPKFHKRDGWYYISAPAGGVATGWQVIFRSRNPYGPYESKIVLHQGSTAINGPHQGALVDTKSGETWFVHFQDRGVVGRISHLQPVQWKDGWPLMGINLDAQGVGEPVTQYRKPVIGANLPIEVPQTSDEFDEDKLGLQWQWHANHIDDWYSLTATPKSLRLFSQFVENGDLAQTPNLLLQKFPAMRFAVDTSLTFSPASEHDRAGLIVMGKKHCAIVIQKTADGFDVIRRENNDDRNVVAVRSATIQLGVDVEHDGGCSFRWRVDPSAAWQPAPGAFQAVQGTWIGAKVGIFCLSTADPAGRGFADYQFFRFRELVT